MVSLLVRHLTEFADGQAFSRNMPVRSAVLTRPLRWVSFETVKITLREGHFRIGKHWPTSRYKSGLDECIGEITQVIALRAALFMDSTSSAIPGPRSAMR